MKEIKIEWTGIRPLLMHSAAMVDPENEYVLEKTRLNKEVKKAKGNLEEQNKLRRESDRASWLGSVYWDSEAGFYMPGQNIFRCIIEAARKEKLGKQAEMAIIPIEDVNPIKTIDYPKGEPEKAYAMPEFSLRGPVRVPPKTGARVIAVRPIIPTGWKVTFTIEWDESLLSKDELVKANTTAGALIGIGTWRPRFGRFTIRVL